MNFSFLTPGAPRTRVPLFRGVGVGGCRGGGVKTSLRILGAVCGFGPRSQATFFLYMDPLTHGGGPGSELQVPPLAPPPLALASEDLAVFTWDKDVYRHLQDFQKLDFFRHPWYGFG